MMAKASCLTGKISFASCRSSSRRKLRGWNTLLVFALTPGPPAHKLRYLNKKVNRSANEMLFCLAFREVFFLLLSWIQISNWTTMRFEGASRFDFFFSPSRTFEELFLPFDGTSSRKKNNGKRLENPSRGKTPRKWMENLVVLWILNWQFRCELH